jgi:guanosine-3',5'-bis(diphosphate) 3'-pyrophosphohydrolase
MLAAPPSGWDLKRKQEYFAWAAAVISGMRGTNSKMEKIFDGLMDQVHQIQ